MSLCKIGEKGWNYFTKLHSRRRKEPNPSLPPFSQQPPTCPVSWTNLRTSWVTTGSLFALSCQEFNFTTLHATKTSMSLQFNMHFVGKFSISLKSHLLRQYHMLLICSKALKCNEKGIIAIQKWTADQQPTDILILLHNWKKQYCKSKPLTSLSYRKKYWP